MNKKKIFFGVVIFIFLWNMFLQEFLWSQIFSSAVVDGGMEEQVLAENITLLENQPTEEIEVKGEKFLLTRKASYAVNGRIMYVDIYDTDFYFGFKSEQVKLNKFYDAFAPLDISLFIGETGADGNWQKIKVSHEYRTFYWQYMYADNPVVNEKEISNNHIIPANNNVRRAFDIMKQGKTVYLEGYLIDWNGEDRYKDIDFKTAEKSGEVAPFFLGGSLTYLCRQFYVTKVIYNGYVYE